MMDVTAPAADITLAARYDDAIFEYNTSADLVITLPLIHTITGHIHHVTDYAPQ